MSYFVLQSLFLLAAAYLLGALLGCWLRRLFRLAPGEMMENAGLGGAVVTGAAGATVVARKLAPSTEREASIEIARAEQHLPPYGPSDDDDVDLYMPKAHPLEEAMEPHLPAGVLPDLTLPTTGLPDVYLPNHPHRAEESTDFEFPAIPDIDVMESNIDVNDLPVVDGYTIEAGAEASHQPIDDLTRIAGIGGPTALALNRFGVTRFEQIAAWRDEDIAWVSRNLGFSGRIERENWMDQARILASGNDIAFSTHQIDEMERADREAVLAASSQEHATAVKSALAAAIGLPGAGFVVSAGEGWRQTGVPLTNLAAGDDLKLIHGVGTNIEVELNRLGFTRFAQIAAWTPLEVAEISGKLGLAGRIDRERWVQQARDLAGVSN